MTENHIPKILNTNCFESYKICRIKGEESTGIGIAVQYVAHSLAHLEKYNKEFSAGLQAEHQALYASHTTAFRTVLHILEEGQVSEPTVPSSN